MTFIKACHHIKNYTASHESRTGKLGEARFCYPQNHIEADNRLSWLLGKLDKIYGDKAFYVHLKRGEVNTAESFSKRYEGGIIKAYRGDGILLGLSKEADPYAVALDYVQTVNENINLFLKNKSQQMSIHLENIEEEFPRFWTKIGAQGELSEALKEFKTRYNASKPRLLSKPITKTFRTRILSFFNPPSAGKK